jgi:hypothetical protein
MTDQDIIGLFETHHPETVEDVKRLGLDPIFIASGCCRKVYKLTPTLAVKIAYAASNQSQTEIAVLEKIHRDPSQEAIRPLVPPLYYGNKKTGTILTKFYPDVVTNADSEEIEPIIKKLNNFGIQDLFALNFRRDEQGNIIVVDLGHYYEY